MTNIFSFWYTCSVPLYAIHIVGGQDGPYRLSSTELYRNNTWHSSVDLPVPLGAHCLVKLNSTHVFLAGGFDGTHEPGANPPGAYSGASYILNRATGKAMRQGDMSIPRGKHACTLLGDQVWVAGGRGDRTSDSRALKSSEYFSLSTSSWLTGPVLPSVTAGKKMLTYNGVAHLIGSRKIWQLARLDSEAGGTWIEVGEMKAPRRDFDVIKMKQKDCKNWVVPDIQNTVKKPYIFNSWRRQL